MQDVFIEYLVKKRTTPVTILLKIGIAVAAVLVALLVLTFSGFLGSLSFLGVVIAVGTVYGAYYLITSQNIEYEYSVTNGEMDVDIIVAQRRRKRLLTVNCKEVEAFGRYKEEDHTQKNYQTKIFACDSPVGEDVWYCSSRQKEKGLTILVFNANEKMLNAIKPYLPRPIMHEAFRIG